MKKIVFDRTDGRIGEPAIELMIESVSSYNFFFVFQIKTMSFYLKLERLWVRILVTKKKIQLNTADLWISCKMHFAIIVIILDINKIIYLYK